jgi:predicted O-linked N-acetylglucosamine transferase (SPINDLY family)
MTTQEKMNLALGHYTSGRLHDAEGVCRQVLTTDPKCAPALHLLGVLALKAGHPEPAADLIRRAIESDPRVSDYYSNLSVALTTLGRFEEAAAACGQALTIEPRFAEAHYNLGNALQGTRALSEAAAEYRAALAIQFDYPQAHNNLGNVTKDMGELGEAATMYRQALVLKRDYAHACSNLANVLKDMGRQAEAVDLHRQALALGAQRPEIHSNMILNLHYQADVDGPAILEESRRWNDRHAAPLATSIVAHMNDRSPDRSLRIGYVSPDLRMHSVAFFLLPLLEARDRYNFDATLYAADPRVDNVTNRLRAASDRFVSLVGVSDHRAAERIREDRIDILVDLSGHTANNRLLLFARKPAPVQVTYLGAAATTGLDAIDYRLTDVLADPVDSMPSDAETLMRVAGSAWCFTPLSGAPPVADLPAMRKGHVTFGSFNNVAKVTLYTLQLWARILQQVPASRLLLKSVAFRTPEVAERLTAFFSDRGIAPMRIELIPEEPSQLAHLRGYDRVDIALDTYPYHGVTTTCEALWMGVPVVTLEGNRHASRIGASLLTHAGYSELVSDSAEEYVRRAVALASDLPRLAAMRAGMRQRLEGSIVMDAPRFARHVETLYREMWRRWCNRAASEWPR